MTPEQNSDKTLLETPVPVPVAAYRGASRIYDAVLEPPLRRLKRAVRDLAGAGPGMRVLDACCGTGVQARLFAGTGAWVAGADLSPHMLNRARRARPAAVTFVLCPSDRLPFPGGAFDMAFMSLAMHETPEALRLEFAAELRRVVRPGGRVMILDYAAPQSANATALLHRNMYHFVERLAGGAHYRNYRHWMRHGALAGFAERSGLGGCVTGFYGGAMGLLTASVPG